MRVTTFFAPGMPKHGLKQINMERLGRVVVLAGKNGAGKSRLLGRLAAWGQERAAQEFGGTFKNIQDNWTESASRRFAEKSGTAMPKIGWWQQADAWHFLMSTYYGYLPGHQGANSALANFYQLEFEGLGSPTFVPFVPKQTYIADPSSHKQSELLQFSKEVETVGLGQLARNAAARIQVIQNRWWNVTHQNSTATTDEKSSAVHDYEGLSAIIRKFLRTPLARSADGLVMLFGLPIGQTELSDGQKILLQFCVAIHAQAEKLSDLIVIMDEPENHLHPEAMLDAISEIEKVLTNGQLWIATHSIPLLAHFDPDCIWWMEDGGIRHAGSQPEIVLRGLVGDEHRVDKIGDFLGLPAALAATNFAYQCLQPPAVVTTDTADPQTLQIKRLLGAHRAGEKLRILDFGAGRGRLVSAIRESHPDKSKILERIDYRAFDKGTQFEKECRHAIARLYDKDEGRFFSKESDLRATLQRGSVDIVVMCNVLHEIDPSEWLSLFSDQGIIRSLLRSDGYLLIVEDMEMRIGEKAHQRGFVVLDTGDIKTLFGIPEDDARFCRDDARGDGRLKAHLVPAAHIGNATSATLKETLKQVRHLAKEEIKSLRLRQPSYREGRKHAFHVQQFANTSLALEVIGD